MTVILKVSRAPMRQQSNEKPLRATSANDAHVTLAASYNKWPHSDW